MASDATYDVFLSYATRDKPEVEELARRLRAAGIKPFLDKWHLVPGEPWQEALEVALDRSRTCAVFLGPRHLGPWQNEEMRAALERRVRDNSHRVIPVLLPGASEPTKKALPPGLKQLTWVEFLGGLDDPRAFHRLVCGIKGIPPGDGPAESVPPSSSRAGADDRAGGGGQRMEVAAVPRAPEAARRDPARGSKARQEKRPSRFLLRLLAAAGLAVVIVTLGLLLAPSAGRWLGQRTPGTGETVNEEKLSGQTATPVPTTPSPSTPTASTPQLCVSGKEEERTEAGIVFVRIGPGTFTMGSAENDPQAYSEEKPAHKVTLSEFWIGKTEVTNEQYRRFNSKHQGDAGLPAAEVSWTEAKAACGHFGGRLPTEAEWEYAARAGSQAHWSVGDDEKTLGEYAWYGEDWWFSNPHPVATKKANTWGLHDMHGNVREWVADWFAPYTNRPQTDPTGPKTGTDRVLRGGAFGNEPRILRSAFRGWLPPTQRDRIVGFRCARDPRSQP